MAGAIPVTCPKCSKQLQVAAELAGKKIRCKGCGEIIPVKAPASKSSPAKPPSQAIKPAPAGKNPTAPIRPAPAKPPAAAPKPPVFDDDDGPATYGFASDDEKAAADKPAVAAAPKLPGEESNPYGLTNIEEGYRCPHCAKEMEEGDIVCLHCGYNTQTREHGKTKRVFDITSQDRFQWLLPGMLCVAAVLALIGFDIFFWIGLKSSWWDPMDEFMENKSFSMGLRVWELIFSLWLMWLAGKFAFNRLIVNPNPPEVERYH
ncbi:MAG: hypothetical protein AB7K24_14365 [Gemmataceae bacterium]